MSEINEFIEPKKKKRRYENFGEIPIKDDIDFTEDTAAVSDNFTIDEKYNNFITQEEVEKLKEFKVLDEVKSNDEDSNDEDSNSSDGNSEGLPGDEIEKMLDEDLPEDFKGSPKTKEKPFIKRTKIVLEEKGINHFEILPLDWMMVRHYSGIPIYMHRATRVCTLAKPYFLGEGNIRKHDIPISAIPCLAYKRGLEEEQKQKEIDRKIEEQIRSGTLAQTEINANENLGNVSLTNRAIHSTSENNVTTPSSNKNQEVNREDSKCKLKIETTLKEGCDRSKEESNKLTNSNQKLVCPMKYRKSGKDSNSLNLLQENETNGTFLNFDSTSANNIDRPQDELMNDGKDKKVEIYIEDKSKEASYRDKGEELQERNEQNSSQADEIPASHRPVILPGGKMMPPPRVETVNTSWKTQHLTAEQITDYCKSLFKFKYVNIMHFKRWADRRKYTKARKRLQCPTLSEATKLVTIPAVNTGTENGGRANKRDWVMNMNGRSYLSVFHEYVHRALQKELVYEFKQLENASMPYQATVFIDGMQYGVGLGSSKRQAKSAAAKASIHILIPEMKEHMEPNNSSDPDFTFFDYVGIEDPRIPELCSTACEPSPHAILRTCLLRNFGAADWHIHTEMKKLEFQKIELTMKVGKHEATVTCKNKKTAKQRAAQSILQALHPHVRSWGSLLRLYGSRSVKSCKEKKLEEQQITLLQDQARHNEPNYAVLEKLRHEMTRLRERDAAVVPIGTVLLPHALPAHSASGLNSVDL